VGGRVRVGRELERAEARARGQEGGRAGGREGGRAGGREGGRTEEDTLIIACIARVGVSLHFGDVTS